MAEPASREEYERRYLENHRVEGFGIVNVANRFPCPFCAAPDWFVVRVMDFGQDTDPIECSECGRSARHVIERTPSSAFFRIVQTGGPDPAEWVQIAREG